jgi:hypothetical protein
MNIRAKEKSTKLTLFKHPRFSGKTKDFQK